MASFRKSEVTNLKNLKYIGFADFSNSKVVDIGKLETVGSDANFENSKIASLKNLKSIGESLFLAGSKSKA